MKKQSIVIGVTGGSGSGKSTFVKQLQTMFSQEELCLFTQDDYYIPREEQEIDENGIRNFDLPTSIDQKAYVADVKKLLAGELVEKMEYCYNNEKATSEMKVFKPAPIILLEGLFIISNEELRDLIDVSVIIFAESHQKVIRRIKRDRVERNYPLEDVMYRYEHHVMPTYEKYIKPYLHQVDLVVNNDTGMDVAISIFEGFIRDRLQR